MQSQLTSDASPATAAQTPPASPEANHAQTAEQTGNYSEKSAALRGLAANSSTQRSKVYELTNESQWDDKGTGHCRCEYCESDESVFIVVRSEADDSELVHVKVVKDDIYQRQQDTLIVWTEPSDGRDLAVSFENIEGCSAVWNQLCEVQHCLGGKPNDESLSDSPESEGYVGSPATLPEPTISNLDDIIGFIRMASQSVIGRDRLSVFIQNNDIIGKLISLFETCEDLEAESELYKLCEIMKSIILLNDTAVLDIIMKRDTIFQVVGMLEHDPDYPNVNLNYREYLSDPSIFKEVVPISDPKLKAKIHETFWLQYLKDVVLARVLDDQAFSILNSRIFFNHVDIISLLQRDRQFLEDLFNVLTEGTEEPVERRRDAVLFIQQFCSIAKNLQQVNRVALYRSLSTHGLFRVFHFAFQDPMPNIRMAGADVLSSILEHDPGLVRSYIFVQIRKNIQPPLLETIIDLFLADKDLGVRVQFLEVMRTLLDTTRVPGGIEALMEGRPPPRMDEEAAQFLEAFYDRYMKQVCSPLLELSSENRMIQIGNVHFLELNQSLSMLCSSLCELLSFAIRSHSFRAKQFILANNVSQKVALLLRARDKSLRLSALRYFRTVVAAKDEFYNRHLIKHDLFAPIVKTFLETEHKNNLVNSACIELFEFIRKENIKSLVEHVWRGFGHHFQGITYVDAFQAFQKRYEQNMDAKLSPISRGGADGGPVDQKIKEWPSSTLDDEEEKYFNGSDDEASTPAVNESSSGSGRALVDYPDEDDAERPLDAAKAAAVTPPISPAKGDAPPFSPAGPKAPAAAAAPGEEQEVEFPPLKRPRAGCDQDDDEDDVFLASRSRGTRRTSGVLRRTTSPVISIRFSAKAVVGSPDRGGGGGGGENGKADNKDGFDVEVEPSPKRPRADR